jgi:hypothetical protein
MIGCESPSGKRWLRSTCRSAFPARSRESLAAPRSRRRSGGEPHAKTVRHLPTGTSHPIGMKRRADRTRARSGRVHDRGFQASEPDRASDVEVPSGAAVDPVGRPCERGRDRARRGRRWRSDPCDRSLRVFERLDWDVVVSPDRDDRRLWRCHASAHLGSARRRAGDAAGIAFLAIITAAITSTFVARAERERSIAEGVEDAALEDRLNARFTLSVRVSTVSNRCFTRTEG